MSIFEDGLSLAVANRFSEMHTLFRPRTQQISVGGVGGDSLVDVVDGVVTITKGRFLELAMSNYQTDDVRELVEHKWEELKDEDHLRSLEARITDDLRRQHLNSVLHGFVWLEEAVSFYFRVEAEIITQSPSLFPPPF